MGSGGILDKRTFKIELLRNGISGILRQSQCVIMSNFFKRFDQTLQLPWICFVVLFKTDGGLTCID